MSLALEKARDNKKPHQIQEVTILAREIRVGNGGNKE